MQKEPNPKIVGIMVNESQMNLPLTQHRLFVHLCVLGAKWGLLVYVFSPQNIECKSLTVQGYKYGSSGWIKETFPLPDLIYDRAFFESQRQYRQHSSAVLALQQLKKTPFLGRSLKGKWSVHKVLIKHPEVAIHIPTTQLFRQPSQLFRWLKEHDSAVLKPESGTQGKGILIITKTGASDFELLGRSMQNQPIARQFSNPFSLIRWLVTFIGHRSYLLQRYLTLRTDQGFAYDIRVLMQKGRRGLWEQTGMALRVGQPNSITSNLHGGGKGADVYPNLEQQFGPERAKALIITINQLSVIIPPMLEEHFGRLAELGLDIGIDQKGDVWVIEVNSKPGRAAAHWFAHPNAMDHAMSNPMRYARYLLSQSLNLATILGG
jgi:glutathione synthase/RimK-type ligase-like ATP-grasp enzyme